MKWLSWITGGTLGAVTETAERVSGIWMPNSEKGAQRSHVSDMAVLEQFSKEFRDMKARTGWDSLVDGLNRLPRPLMALAIVAMFVLAPVDPVRFHQIALAYEAMPEGFWLLLSVIVSFYFGGKMQLYSQQFKIKGGALDAARKAVKGMKEISELDGEQEISDPPLDVELDLDAKPPVERNHVLAQWLKLKKS